MILINGMKFSHPQGKGFVPAIVPQLKTPISLIALAGYFHKQVIPKLLPTKYPLIVLRGVHVLKLSSLEM